MNSKLLIRRQTILIVFRSLVLLTIAAEIVAQAPSATLASAGTTYYVSPTGSDSNDGLSRSSAWQTIQHAANLVNPGDTAVVTAGTYNERVTVTRSGASGQLITLAADSGATVTMQGFEITASYTQETGFDITNNNQTAQQGWGVYLGGSNNVVSYNSVHDVCFEGIYVSGNGNLNSTGTANNLVAYNTVTRAEMSGITVEGQNNLIEYNNVSQTLQYPPNCPQNNGADADGFRFFGNGHIFKGNVITNIAIPGSQYNPNPHTDCFQTWAAATNMTFDGNWCQMPTPSVTSSGAGNEIGIAENLDGYVANLLFMNNVFINLGQGFLAQGDGGGPLPGIQFFNNTVDNIMQEGVVLQNAPAAQIIDNIFYNVGSGGDNYLAADSASANFSAGTNDMYMSDGSKPGTYGSSAPQMRIDPQFSNVGSLDFQLSPASQLINAGTWLPQVSHNYSGVARRQGQGSNIGAF